MSMRVDSNQLIAGRCVVTQYPGHGIKVQDIPSDGESGPAALYGDAIALGALPTDEMRWQILTAPASGVFTPYESSEFTLVGASDGAHYSTYLGFINGAPYLNPETDDGEWIITMTIGDAQPQLSGTALFPRFTATGALDVTAQPAMLTGNSRMPKFSASGAMTAQPGEMQISCAASLPSLSMSGTLVVYYSPATGDPLIMKQDVVNERRSIEERNNQPN